MPTIHVRPEVDLHMQQVADTIGKSKKVVVVTGAGISTNCGIPVSSLVLLSNSLESAFNTLHRISAQKMGCIH
jgi:hypothetical protein